MAVRTATVTSIDTFGDHCHIVAWSGLTSATTDTGSPLEMGGSADRSIQITGTFGAGGTLLFEGSNDGTTYATLTDPQGNALSITAAKIETVMELCRFVRPRISAGDGTTSLVCTMFLRRP